MLKQGMTPAGGTPEELRDLIRSDFERWNRIVREANIKAD
jgi:tripartite-type tricarboxylate transporter receptor subunit TctC